MSEPGIQGNETGIGIAVIGMACRFPGANNIYEFWNNLKNGEESISFLSNQELQEAGVETQTLNNPNYIKVKGGILENMDLFDASFFNYIPLEAEVMDPQIRIFHECAWEALEDSGYAPGTHKGWIGLYAGASSGFYWQVLSEISGKNSKLGEFDAGNKNDKDFLCTMVSFKLNLKGPSVSIQTACSTGLVTIHLASQAILYGECDMALAGGINAAPQHNTGYIYQEGMIKSGDGHCRAFDARATGAIGGSGVGIAVLKSLDEAIAAGDHIYAVIKGTAINNDGIEKAGFTAPSREGQTEVIRMAHQVAEVEAESITYIEAHGTGTAIGDPIEIEALKQAFNTDKKEFCAVGSVKTNIGHLDAAAGIASFIKTVLAIKHRLIPPSLHYENPNPKIDFENSPFYVNTLLAEWKNETYPLRAGVSSFGIGGTNAHIVLEEYLDNDNRYSPSREYQLILLSAKTRTVLDRMTKNLTAYSKNNPGINLADTAYTLKVGRSVFPHRRFRVCNDLNNAVENLFAEIPDRIPTFYTPKETLPVVFMFPGQGAQYMNMGLGLYKNEQVFRENMERCFKILHPLIGYDLKEIIYPSEHTLATSGEGMMDRVEIAHPLVFAFEYSLAKLLMKWGIKPQAMIGYSLGEYTAACIAGVFSLEDALEIIVYRSRLIRETGEGAMLSVPATVEELKPILPTDLSIAIDNGLSCIVAGPKDLVKSFEKKLKKEKLICIQLQTSYAVHSKLMESISKRFAEKFAGITLNKPRYPYISNVTGKFITDDQALDPGYWAMHLRSTVKFAHGVKELLKEPGAIFIEVGPGKDLSALMSRYLENNRDHYVINMVRHPQKDAADMYYLLNKIGYLWLYGGKIDWPEFYSGEKRYRIPLPTYPFDGNFYPPPGNNIREMIYRMLSQSRGGKKKDISDWFYITSWESSLSLPPETDDMHVASCWLVFLDDCGVGSRLVKRLEKEGRDFITVKKGTALHREKPGQYIINPGNSRDFDTLFNELRETGKIPGTIVHLWCVTGNSPGNPALNRIDVNHIEKLLDWGFYSLFYITRAIGKQNIPGKIQIGVVTDHAHDVTGDEAVCPIKAIIYGALKVIPQEYENIRCCAIDVPRPGPGSPMEAKLTDQLLQEFSRKFNGSIIAFRNNQRRIQTLVPVKLGANLESRAILKEKGVYLITGGHGSVGLMLAEYLARKVNARLILTGRSRFLPREQWEQWLADHDGEDNLSYKIHKIKELEELGARVLILKADVSDEAQMQQVIREAEKQFGNINGVIHAAGELDPQTLNTIADMDKTLCSKQFIPKLYGTMVLDKVLGHRKLDFCILMSSLSTVLGGLGFVAYSSANSFMDIYAQCHNKVSPVPWISVNWDGWEPPGKKQSGDFITMSEGGMAFQRILACDGAHQVVVSISDIYPQIERWIRLVKSDQPGAEEPGKEDAVEYHQRPDLSNPYTPPATELEQSIADTWQKFLGIQRVGIHDDFFELGGDSLKALQLAEILKKSNIDTNFRQILLHQNIYEICKNLTREEKPLENEDKEMNAIENYLSEKYDTDVYFREYQCDSVSYRILFLIREPIEIHRVWEDMENKLSSSSSSSSSPLIYPDFIIFVKPGDTIPGSGDIDNEVLVKLLDLKDRVSEEDQARFADELNQNKRLSILLKENTITREYEVSPTQRLFLVPPYKDIASHFIYYSYHFSYPADIAKIRDVIVGLIRKNSLLRSVITAINGSYFIREFDSFSNIRLPLIDISGYSPACKEETRDEILRFLRKPIDVFDHVLFRIAVLKVDHSHYELIFELNHLIFDGTSAGILGAQLDNLTRGTGYPQEKETSIKGYQHYTEFLNAQNYEDIHLEKHINLHQYSRSIEEITKKYNIADMKQEVFELDISIINEKSRGYYNEIVLWVYAKTIGHFFGVDKVPIIFTSHGRTYKYGDFNHTIGDYHDLIPVLFHLDKHTAPMSMMDHFIRYKEFVRENNLNFINYVVKGYVSDIDYTGLLSPFNFNSIIGSYEYYEKISLEEFERRKSTLKISTPNFFLGLLEDFYAGKLLITIFQNSPFLTQKVFTRNYTDLVSDLNKENTAASASR
jgi:acyl transferase domain-containing protein